MLTKNLLLDTEEKSNAIILRIDRLATRDHNGLCTMCGASSGHFKWCAAPALEESVKKMRAMMSYSRKKYAVVTITSSAYSLRDLIKAQPGPVEKMLAHINDILAAIAMLQDSDDV